MPAQSAFEKCDPYSAVALPYHLAGEIVGSKAGAGGGLADTKCNYRASLHAC